MRPASSRRISTLEQTLKTEKRRGNPLIPFFFHGDITVLEPALRGDNIYPKLEKCIENAQVEILIQFYKMGPDSDGARHLVRGLQSLNAKLKRQNKTVSIKILINARAGPASWAKPNRYNDPVKKLIEDVGDTSCLNIEYAYHRHLAFGSYHSKFVIVDGAEAMLFSGDISKDSDYRRTDNGSSDRAPIIRRTEISSHFFGAPVSEIKRHFERSWSSRNTKKHSISPHTIEVCHETSPCDYSSQAEPRNHSSEAPPIGENVPALFISKKSNGWLFRRNYLSPYTIALIRSIETSKRFIDILMPNINCPEVIKALSDAVKRGVEVRMVVGRTHNDIVEAIPFIGGTNRKNIKKLIKMSIGEQYCGNSVSNLRIRWAGDTGGDIVNHGDPQTMHAKYANVDSLVFVGSSVCDLQSVYHSGEFDCVMDSDGVSEYYTTHIFNPIYQLGKQFSYNLESWFPKNPKLVALFAALIAIALILSIVFLPPIIFSISIYFAIKGVLALVLFAPLMFVPFLAVGFVLKYVASIDKGLKVLVPLFVILGALATNLTLIAAAGTPTVAMAYITVVLLTTVSSMLIGAACFLVNHYVFKKLDAKTQEAKNKAKMHSAGRPRASALSSIAENGSQMSGDLSRLSLLSPAVSARASSVGRPALDEDESQVSFASDSRYESKGYTL